MPPFGRIQKWPPQKWPYALPCVSKALESLRIDQEKDYTHSQPKSHDSHPAQKNRAPESNLRICKFTQIRGEFTNLLGPIREF